MWRILITMRGELLCLIVTRERNDLCCTIIIPSKVDTSIKQATFKSSLALTFRKKEHFLGLTTG